MTISDVTLNKVNSCIHADEIRSARNEFIKEWHIGTRNQYAISHGKILCIFTKITIIKDIV